MISLNKHSISASIVERYACICYEFAFENLNEGRSRELCFQITIGTEAFISGFIANIDGELFYGETKEKKQAKQEYETAKEKNENAILVSQPHTDIPNVFQIKTNIDSKSKILLTIQIEQYLTKKFNFNQLTIEVLKEFYKYNIRKTYDAIAFEFNISEQSGIYDIDIPLHENDIIIQDKIIEKLNENTAKITGKIMDKSLMNELILKYKVKGEQTESNILYDSKTKTFCHIISDLITNTMTEGTMDAIETNVLIPRRVVIVIDRSGSMGGIKWTKTISATITALKQLRCNYDRYCVILCGNKLVLHPQTDIVLTDNKNVDKCIKYLETQRAQGCELINDALIKGVELIKDDIQLLNENKNICNYYQNQIILLTDGEPTIGETNTDKIILNVKNVNDLRDIDKYSSKVSVHSFGIGSDRNDGQWANDLNHSFLKLLSLNNNGIYQRIKQTRTDKLLNEYFDILSKPILTNIKIKYEDSNCTNLTTTSFNTLYSGNDIIICGQLQKNKTSNMTVNISAITGKQIQQNDGTVMVKPIEINKTIKVNFNDYKMSEITDDEKTDKGKNNNTVERIWAYLKLKQFAEQRLMDNDMIEYDEFDDKIPLELAMKYKFVTPWTSMIVVKHKTQAKKAPEIEAKPHISDIDGYEEKDDFDEHIFDENLISHKMDLMSRCCAAMSVSHSVTRQPSCFMEEKCDMDEYSDEDYGGLDDDDEILTLKSGGPNPISFEIPKRFAESSKFVTTILEGDSDATSIEIRQVLPETLTIVLSYLNSCADKTWNAIEWIDSFDMKTTFQIVDAANYMDIKNLYCLAKNAIKRKEEILNKLIDEKLLYLISKQKQTNKTITIIDDLLLIFDHSNALLKDCTVENMIYLTKQMCIQNVLSLNDAQKGIICRYFKEAKIDSKRFILLTKKDEFIKNLTLYAKENDYKPEISNKALKILQTNVLNVIT